MERNPTRFFLSDGDPASKQAILEAALGLFVEHGLAGTNVRMIGAAAGYSNPAMFKFFESKEALAVYLFERCYLRLFTSVDAAASAPKFDEALERVIDTFLRAMEEDLEALLFVQDTLRELWPKVTGPARNASILRTLSAMFERGIGEGRVHGHRSVGVSVAVLVGSLAQLGRMLYFRELPGPASHHRRELTSTLKRMLGR